MPDNYALPEEEDLTYESKWNREAKERNQRLRLTIANSLQLDPERSRRITGVAGLTGLPDEVIDADLENLETKLKADQFDYDKYLRESPQWTEFASKNKYHLSILREDQKAMGGLERTWNAIGIGWDSGWAMTELGNLRSAQMSGAELTPEEIDRMDKLREMQVAHEFGAEGGFAKFLVKNAKMMPTTFYSMKEGIDEAAIGALAYGSVAAAMGQAGPQAALPEEAITVPGAMAMGARHGMMIGAGDAAFRLERGLAYDQFLEMGIPEKDARLFANMVGSVNSGLEVTGFNKLTKYMPGFRQINGVASRQLVSAALSRPTFRRAAAQYGARFGEALGTEVLTEVLQETSNMVAGEYLKSQQRAAGDDRPEMQEMTWNEWKETWVDVALETLQGAAIISSVGPTYNFYIDSRRASAANEQVAKFKALGEYTKESKTREEVPTKWREWLDHLTENGDVKDIRIDAEGFKKYFQSKNLDPTEVANRLGVKIPAEGELDTDVVIPIAAYADQMAATEHHDALIPDMRIHPEDSTQREAEQWLKNKDQHIADVEAAIGLDVDRSAQEQIEKDTMGMLVGEGKYTEPAAQKMAKLHSLVIINKAQQAGVDPLQLHKETLAGIRAEVPGALAGQDIDMEIDPLIDRIRNKDFPKQRDIFGESLIDMIRDVGGILDEGGELSSRDFGKQFVGVISKKGKSLDAIAEIAQEQGYITAYDQDQLLEAIDRELSGERVFSRNAVVDQQLDELRAKMEQAAQWFETEGIDLNDMSNAEVRKAIDGIKTLDQALFHGSPFSFAEFTMEAIGSGEGAQAYGYGLYFAEEKAVAEIYKRSNEMHTIIAKAALEKFDNDEAKAEAYLRSTENQYSSTMSKKAADIIKSGSYKDGGHVYEVQVDDDSVANMLDWDAPLSKQSEGVRKALEQLPDPKLRARINGRTNVGEELKGGQIYDEIQRYFAPSRSNILEGGTAMEGSKAASQELSDIGIPGIKFRDHKSRTSGVTTGNTGFIGALTDAMKANITRNMVLFSTDSITEVKRDGELVYDQNKQPEQSSMSDLEAYTRLLAVAMDNDPTMYTQVMKKMPKVADEQDFSGVTFTDTVRVTETGETAKVTKDAQKSFDSAVKRKNVMQKLLECVSG